MHNAGYRLPRILIPRTPVNKPRRGSSEVTVIVVEAAPKHPILPHSSRVPNRLYLHFQRGLPVGSCMSLRLVHWHARDNLRKDTGRLRITGLHEHARYPDYEHDHGQHHEEAFGLAHATRLAPARSPKPRPDRGSLLQGTSENSYSTHSGE